MYRIIYRKKLPEYVIADNDSLMPGIGSPEEKAFSDLTIALSAKNGFSSLIGRIHRSSLQHFIKLSGTDRGKLTGLINHIPDGIREF